MDDRTVSAALARAGMAHRARAAELLAAVGLHPGQEFLLAALHERGPTPVGRLAEALGVEQPTVTKMASRMEAAGLVRRGADPTDARRTLLELTDAGAGAHRRAVEVWKALEAETVADLEPAEAERLLDLLRRVRASLTGDAR